MGPREVLFCCLSFLTYHMFVVRNEREVFIWLVNERILIREFTNKYGLRRKAHEYLLQTITKWWL